MWKWDSMFAMKSTKAFRQILAVVGATLAELRKKKGYPTIKEFTQRYDLPEIQYWRIEKGKANITLKTLVNILAIHKLTLYEFFCLVMEEEGVKN
jgi:transcriptional regulator with XRE-family HTH domain